MAVPHYAYLLLKMPGNTGALSLRGDLLKSFECNKEAIDHTSSIRVPSSISEILAAAKELSLNKDSMPSKKPSQSSVKLTGDVALLQRPPSPPVQNSYHRRFWGALDLTRW